MPRSVNIQSGMIHLEYLNGLLFLQDKTASEHQEGDDQAFKKVSAHNLEQPSKKDDSGKSTSTATTEAKKHP